jgi:uncharacterized protein GlcG (DUF336 family)
MKKLGFALALCASMTAPGGQQALADDATCTGLPTAAQLKAHMIAAAGPTVGGLFNGTRMWAAVVNRSGQLCAFATSTDDPSQVWPGSQAIAKAKAYTANAFSLDALAAERGERVRAEPFDAIELPVGVFFGEDEGES